MMTPGTYLKKRRVAAGLSIIDLAAMVHTNPRWGGVDKVAWIDRIEHDVAALSPDVIATLAGVFRFSPTVLGQLITIRSYGEDAIDPAPRLVARRTRFLQRHFRVGSKHQALLHLGEPVAHPPRAMTRRRDVQKQPQSVRKPVCCACRRRLPASRICQHPAMTPKLQSGAPQVNPQRLRFDAIDCDKLRPLISAKARKSAAFAPPCRTMRH